MLDEALYQELVRDEASLMSFVTDMAQGIQHIETICARYGFINRAVLYHFIDNNPAVARLIQQHKAAYDSDDNVERRIRLKAGLSVEATIHHMFNIIRADATPVSQKIDCFHKLLRAAGTDGAPPAARAGDMAGGGGPSFTLNFIWSDGSRENVLTARPIPPPVVIEHEGRGVG